MHAPIQIDTTTYRSTAFDDRHGCHVQFLILHYTDLHFRDTMDALCPASDALNRVSAHYVIPELGDITYNHSDITIWQLVSEQHTAWHAGTSRWEKSENLNAMSIGIENVYCPTHTGAQTHYPDYCRDQIAALIVLCQDILTRYPAITPTHVLGHSDIAPVRKLDPGSQFPWFLLYQQGIGAWYPEDLKLRYQQTFSNQGLPSQDLIQTWLKQYGYGYVDEAFEECVTAFQLHFRPHLYDGIVDIETAAILAALVERYSLNKVS